MLSLVTTFLALRAPAVGKQIGRRAVLGAATAVVAAPAAFALSPEERAFEAAAGYQKAVSQCENDACAALLTPKLVVANGGAKSAKVVVSGPASDKLPKGDFVDCVWLSNSRGSILRAAEFKPLGKAINAAASTDAVAVAVGVRVGHHAPRRFVRRALRGRDDPGRAHLRADDGGERGRRGRRRGPVRGHGQP